MLINTGKILEDEKKVADYKIQEKDFLVVMVTKVRFGLFYDLQTSPTF